MSYIDAKRIGDTVFVSERRNKKLHIRQFPAPYYFYVEDEDGTHTSMFGDKVSELRAKSYREFQKLIDECKNAQLKTFESDVKIEYKLLEREYTDDEIEQTNIAVFDIETETDYSKGFADFSNPYGRITAITVTKKWLDETNTYALIPPTLTMAEAEALCVGIPNLKLFDDEADVLAEFLIDIDDADILTGWNSNTYDLPYIVQRLRIVFGGEKLEEIGDLEFFDPSTDSLEVLSKLCRFDFQVPTLRRIEHYGKEVATFNLCGRVHLDYLDLYRKFSMGERHSYKLDYILQYEIDERKVAYDGTLEELWRNDFRKFVEYNIQDTKGLSKLDDKLKFINLAYSMAHQSGVAIKEALGSVAIIEQAILVELHKQGKVAPDKKETSQGAPVAGAYVYEPQGGMYDWVVSFDINSLYPSVIRMLNISPECLIGQFDISETEAELDRLVDEKVAESRTEAWHHFTGVREYHEIVEKKSDKYMTFYPENGSKMILTAAEWNEFLETENMCVSANGTVFDLNKQGIIPYCLEKWYNERKVFQKRKKDCAKAGDTEGEAYWDMRQYVMKIFLNSTYGALLNAFFRFYDPRFGQSVTLSGRVITKHMIKKANEIICGKYDFGDSTIYGDTDSCYATVEAIAKNLMANNPNMSLSELEDILIKLADEIGDEINTSFPPKMMEAFFVTESQGDIIKSGREVVARRGIFKHLTKKRYALSVIDLEGKRCEKLKVMGMETQRSDTPEWIQGFLEECLESVVMRGQDNAALLDIIREFKDEFYERDVWKLGRPCRVRNLTIGSQKHREYISGETWINPRVHFSVIAADNFNRYLEFFGDKVTAPIVDGDKIEVVCLLMDNKTNPLKFDSIALPVGNTLIPSWIKSLPVDVNTSYAKLIDKKLNNIFDMMKWDFTVVPKGGFNWD